jgi:hypothetical protein
MTGHGPIYVDNKHSVFGKQTFKTMSQYSQIMCTEVGSPYKIIPDHVKVLSLFDCGYSLEFSYFIKWYYLDTDTCTQQRLEMASLVNIDLLTSRFV